MCWLGFNFITPHNLFTNLECLEWGGERKKMCKGFWLVWHAAIWKARNDKFFNNQIKEVGEMVDEITVLSWRWGFTRLKYTPCLFYVWC